MCGPQGTTTVGNPLRRGRGGGFPDPASCPFKFYPLRSVRKAVKYIATWPSALPEGYLQTAVLLRRLPAGGQTQKGHSWSVSITAPHYFLLGWAAHRLQTKLYTVQSDKLMQVQMKYRKA